MSDRLDTAAEGALRAVRAAVVSLMERFLGMSSRGEIPREELGFSSGAVYRATPWRVLYELFRNLEVAEDDVLADVGSGMGRAVFMAARRPFKRVIGIERSEELTGSARANIDRNRHRLTCKDVELLTVDVLEWRVPDDLTVVYLFCPFPEDVFERLVAKLVASIDRRPRPLRLIYHASTIKDREVLLATGRARRISYRVPRYARSRFKEVSMFLLLPSGWGATSEAPSKVA